MPRSTSLIRAGFLFACICIALPSSAHAETAVDADLVQDATWTIAESPYVIATNIQIPTGVTLTIEPGVEVVFERNIHIDVYGTFVAGGQSGVPIRITSNAVTKAEGDYQGINFKSGSTGNFDYLDMRYAAAGISGNEAILTITNSVFSENARAVDGSMMSLRLENSEFTDNTRPVNIDYGSMFTHSGNIFSKNTYDGYAMAGSIFYGDYTFTDDAPYYIFSDPRVRVGETITIEPGATLRSDDTSSLIQIHWGTLDARGTTAKPITFSNLSISLIENGNAEFEHVSFDNAARNALQIVSNSHVALKNCSITGAEGDAILMFGDSSLRVEDATISSESGNGITVFGNSTLSLLRTTIDKAVYGVEAFNHALVSIDDSLIKNATAAGILTYGEVLYLNTELSITDTEIADNDIGISLRSFTTVSATGNSIHDNGFGVMNQTNVSYDIPNTWWGDMSGPENALNNPGGLGDGVTDNVTFTPWFTRDPNREYKTPVLFIPGILGTEISEQTESGTRKLWANLEGMVTDIGDDFMDALRFDEELRPVNNDLFIEDVIKSKEVRDFALFDYTKGLIEQLEIQGYSEIEDIFMLPYDWRYGIDTERIQQLREKIENILEETGAEKVDIVAHSAGGLLAKKYVMEYGGESHIGKAVFVGVTNTGAPDAVQTLFSGTDFSIPFLNRKAMKNIAANLPMVYELAPSREYYAKKGSFIKLIDQHAFSSTIRDLNFEESKDIILSSHGLNAEAFSRAETLHTPEFDNFDMRSAGVDVYAIDGCKTPTVGKISEVHTRDILGNISISYQSPTYVPGDNTVPLESATNLPIDPGHKYYALEAKHSGMPSQDGVRQQIVKILSGDALSTDGLITEDISLCKLKGRAISIYSPLSIDITDGSGNHAGFMADGTSIENTIPNASYQIIDEHKFIYLPEDDGQEYTVAVEGTGNGTFTLTDANISDNEIVGMQVFKDIPVTTLLQGTLKLGDITELLLDTDGDLATDQTLTPSLTLSAGEAVLYDPTLPTETKSEETTTENTSGGGGGRGARIIFATILQNNSPAETSLPPPENERGETLIEVKSVVKEVPFQAKEKESIEPEKEITGSISEQSPESNLTASVIGASKKGQFYVAILGIIGLLTLSLIAKKIIKSKI